MKTAPAREFLARSCPRTPTMSQRYALSQVVVATIAGMGALSTKKKPDHAEGMLEGGGDDGPGSWPGANGDNNGSSDSVEAKDTLFLKELTAKGQVRWAI